MSVVIYLVPDYPPISAVLLNTVFDYGLQTGTYTGKFPATLLNVRRVGYPAALTGVKRG